MQFTKDSFLNHLATKLAEVDSAKTIMIDGVTRPAVMARENERAELAETLENCYCIDWRESSFGYARAMRTLRCTISYWTTGSAEMSGVDRGRVLTGMDELLRELLAERRTAKVDYRKTPALDLGSKVVWSLPSFGAAEQIGMKLKRAVKVDVHYFAEDGQ